MVRQVQQNGQLPFAVKPERHCFKANCLQKLLSCGQNWLGTCLADFEEHGTLVERFARLLDPGKPTGTFCGRRVLSYQDNAVTQNSLFGPSFLSLQSWRRNCMKLSMGHVHRLTV